MIRLTAVVLAAVGDGPNLGAYISAFSRDVAEIEVGILSSSDGSEAGEESDLGEEHIGWSSFYFLKK